MQSDFAIAAKKKTNDDVKWIFHLKIIGMN